MKNTGTLILKYHGDAYQCKQKNFEINMELTNGTISFGFTFEFPGSSTIEKVNLNLGETPESDGAIKPFGLEFIKINAEMFYLHFNLVEELEEAELFGAVAMFKAPFPQIKDQFSVYDFTQNSANH